MTPSPPPAEPLSTGLLVLHGNRLETLADTVAAWLAAHPLAPLEDEVVLVPSNGMAEWLKMRLAAAHGVCAATRVELPARFLWRAWREVLGREAVPEQPALDEAPMTWRLMRLLPALTGEGADAAMAPLAAFLAAGDRDVDGGADAGEDAGEDGPAADPLRRLQLAQRLADLYDQYQLYRADWLADWAAGRDLLRPATGAPQPLPAEQRWQPALWRALLGDLAPAQAAGIRPELHEAFLQALRMPGPRPALPRRLVVFGSTHLPLQTLHALAAMSAHVQVLMAVPDPCRWHWADTLDGRELLAAPRRRLPLRGGRALDAVPLAQMHAHGHPLLSAWGRQARDFVRQLDAFDDAQAARAQFALPRLDLFDDTPGETLLQQVQAAVRELLPLAEHPRRGVAEGDRSIVFHVAHGPMRELEVLHDALLDLFAAPPGGTPLAPRDVVVMLPDVDAVAPAIRAVFGRYGRGDPRHIPWGITDLRARGHHPLLVALETLLAVPRQRLPASVLHDLLDVPALAARFGIAPADRPQLDAWIAEAGIRWGLHEAQRASLGLAAAGDTGSWRFGLRRLLLGWAGGGAGFGGIEPAEGVAGLAAAVLGALAELVETLDTWWADARRARPPAAWAQRLRALLAACFLATDDAERAVLAALDAALAQWLQACESAGFDEAVELAVAAEAWLQGLDAPGTATRFRAGGVTFCTLLPLRAIPFEVVCLLGMNDGDYPRRAPRSDFDLMALPGMARPGDRSRRDDDRQLMLDALLSARRVLHVSWSGRSVRDNAAQPPSVLVAQLRDYLAAGWGDGVPEALTTTHPLQPFSRRYFEAGSALHTWASEWRAAHEAANDAPPPVAAGAAAPLRLTLAELQRCVRRPVRAFFLHRLQVRLGEDEVADLDDESFAAVGLERHALLDDSLRALQGGDAAALADDVAAQVARLQRAGRLPLGAPGRQAAAVLAATLQPMLAAWHAARAECADEAPPLAVTLEAPGLTVDDTLAALRRDAGGALVHLELQPGTLGSKAGLSGDKLRGDKLRGDKLLGAWLRGLVAAAAGRPLAGIVIGADAIVRVAPFAPEAARGELQALLGTLAAGLGGERPLATALKTGLAWLSKPTGARAAFEGDRFRDRPGEGDEPEIARLWPDADALLDDPRFAADTQRLYGPLHAWLQGLETEALPDAAAADAAGGADDD